MNESSDNDFAVDSLEKLRRRLLDLTARNRLLNFTHGRQGNVRVIDELADELQQMLLSEEELRFQAIPDPTREELIEFGYIEIDPETGLDSRVKKDPSAAEWARLLGFDVSYLLPVPSPDGSAQVRHHDKVIQTLMFPSEMETRLRGLRNRAETAIEETGANICYIAFGFLEWFDSPDSDKARYAPLLLVPVRIVKGRLNPANGTYNYTVSYTGEDILPNLSLREKLRIDFGLALPDLDESTSPENYFLEVSRLIEEPKPKWQVRRWVSVALFNFSKLLMYLDLDPARWPDEYPITDHPIVSQFFATTSEEGEETGFSDEYAIDDLPDVHDRFPIIDDADSSQHSALVDVIEGKNLVIEGPPGTGNSQTITNLIAAALAQGKRVLFVAEKLAALEVVKRRLDHAGLGDFCLELHSHKTQKRKVLDDIATRLNNQDKYCHPEQFGADIARYEKLKDELRAYAELINTDWKSTGLTVHGILATATRYREELGIDPAAIHPAGYDGGMFTGEIQRESLDAVRIFADVYRLVAQQLNQGGDLQSHPWYGIGNRDLQLFDRERVCSALSGWQSALDDLAGEASSARALLGDGDRSVLRKLDGIEILKNDLGVIPPLSGSEILPALPHLRGSNLSKLTDHLELFGEIRACQQKLSECLRPEFLGNPETHRQLRSAHEELKYLGLEAETSLSTLAKRLKRIERLLDRTRELGKPMAEVALRLGHSYTDVIRLTESGLREFRNLVDLVGRLRPALLKLRRECFDDDSLDDILPELEAKLDALKASRQELAHHFALDRLPAPSDLDEMQRQLVNTGLFRWFDGDWRASRRLLLQLSSKPGSRFKDLAIRLGQLSAYANDKRALEDDARYKNALGAYFAGIDTPVSDLSALRVWYKSVRARYGVGFGPKVALGNTLLGMRTEVARGIQSLSQQGIVAVVDDALRELGELKSAFDQHVPIQKTNEPLVLADGPLPKLKESLTTNLDIAQRQLNDPNASLASLETTVEDLKRLESFMRAWRMSDGGSQWFGGRVDLLIEPDQLDDESLAAAKQTEALARVLEDSVQTKLLREAIYRNPCVELFEQLGQLREALTTSWHNFVDHRSRFAEVTELDLDAWQRGTGGTLDGLSSRNWAALDEPDWLSNWLDYVRVRHQSVSIGFGSLTKAVEQGVVPADDIDAGYQLAVHDLLAREILKEVPALARFSGNAQLALQKQFIQYDRVRSELM